VKILFLTNNNDTSYPLQRWLESVAKEDVIVWKETVTPEAIVGHHPGFLISYNYRFLIKPEIIRLLPRRIINLHISYLPWNRGAHPNLWSFLEDTPKGVTIHFVDPGLDTGEILVQKEMAIDETKETLKSSYDTLHSAIRELFINHWDLIKNGKITPHPQPAGGSKHSVKDFGPIKHILGQEGWNIPITELKKRYRKWKSSEA
jgi:methionyl-tRNA formyltransferase